MGSGIAADHAGFERITLATGETAHAQRATPFGDLDVFGLKIVGRQDGGFRK